MNETQDPRYRDHEGSRFYRSGRLSPQETWRVLGDELGRVLDDAERAFWRKPLRMDAERVRWWHGAIFARSFPRDGGRFRKDRAFFGVVAPAGGMRQLEGSSPATLRRDLEAVCVASNQRLEHLRATATPALMDCTRAVGALYAGILRVHPFADGNHRASFVVLSAALWSLGLPNVDFLLDDEVRVHDEVLAPALSSGDGSIEPFARLLRDLIEDSAAPGP